MTSSIGRVQSPSILHIGGGVVQETADVLRQLGLSKPLIATDKTLCALWQIGTYKTFSRARIYLLRFLTARL